MVSAMDLQQVQQTLQDAIARVSSDLTEMKLRADGIITDMKTQDQNLRSELAGRTAEMMNRMTATETNVTGIETHLQRLSQIGLDQVNLLGAMTRGTQGLDDQAIQNWIQGSAVNAASMTAMDQRVGQALTNLDARVQGLTTDRAQMRNEITTRIPVPTGDATDLVKGKPIMDSKLREDVSKLTSDRAGFRD